ncbi:MAG: signal recognition particle receptor subunit alpha [archaeon]
MFGFFKTKIKEVIEKFSKKAEEDTEKTKEIEEEKIEEVKEEKKIEVKEEKREHKEEKAEKEEKKKYLEEKKHEEVKEKKKEDKEYEEIKEKKKKEEEKIEFKEEEEELEEEKEEREEIEEKKEKKKGFFAILKEKLTTTKIDEEKFDKLFWDLEVVLMENNVAVEVIDKIKDDLKKNLVDVPIRDVKKTIESSLRESLDEILDVPKLDVIEKIKDCKKEKRAAVFLILGYNGSGKSISCAKFAQYLKNKGFRSILAAGDTFRMAGSFQLGEYAKRINVPVIQTETKGDSCALIFDTIKSANAKGFDVVIADTAGRLHSNADLMDELKKIVRVNKPDLKILVVDALTGADVVEQCREFDKNIGIDALIFTKVDAYEKGGGLLSATYILKKPILFLGVGQLFTDIKLYDKNEILKSLGF